MGRLKGGKNKPKISDSELEIKKDNTLFGNEKEIKKEIRKLRKLKLQCRAGSKERIELHRQIKELKKHKVTLDIVEPGKEKVIAEILKVEVEKKLSPRFGDIGIDLHKYTEAELEIHLKRITEPNRAGQGIIEA